jgi:hypothetical protein
MMFANEKTTAQIGQLFDEAKRYWELQKQHLSLNSVEILTRLFSTLVLVLILILVGSLVLLFGSFALAYWLGELLDSMLLGFGIIASILLLLALMVYANRRSWIVRPTTQFMVSLLASSLAVPTQDGITIEKAHLRQQMDENLRDLKESANTLLAPLPAAKNRWDNASFWFQNGMNLYRGIQLGASAIVALRSIFKFGRKRK